MIFLPIIMLTDFPLNERSSATVFLISGVIFLSPGINWESRLPDMSFELFLKSSSPLLLMKVILPFLLKRMIVSFRLLMIESKGTIFLTVVGVHEMYHTYISLCKKLGVHAERRGVPRRAEV